MDAAAGLRHLAAGTMLDDKYRVERLLAVGGMGAVYVGTHVKLRKRVAIKVLNPQLTSDAMLQRFHREAITASQIGHEGIAQVTDLGTSTEGEAFLVMELLEGESLANRLKATGPLPVELACELGCAILSPLEAAHRAGIIHRDLKPDNVFLVRQSRGELVKLLDFGISRATGLEGDLRLTNTGVVMGTPYYMSPEQARGDSEVSTAADIYSFGVILYEMLVGRVPITGENYNQLLYRVMTAEYEPPRVRRPDLPEALEQVILRAMALEPSERMASAAELEQALLAFCRSTYREHMIERISNAAISWGTPPPHSPSQPRISSPPHAPQGTDPTLIAPSAIVPPKRSKLPLILGAVLVIGAGIATVAAIQGGDDKPDAPSVTAGSAPAAAPPAQPAPTPIAPPPAEPAPAAAPAPATITLRFSVEPKTATITLDGKPVPGTEVTVEKDGADHVLAISARGFVTREETLRFVESQRLVIDLDRERPRPRTRPSAPKVKPTQTPTRPDRSERIDTQSPYSK